MSETYVAGVRCTNCGWYGDIKIPKGTTVGTFLHDGKCTVCGCASLARG